MRGKKGQRWGPSREAKGLTVGASNAELRQGLGINEKRQKKVQKGGAGALITGQESGAEVCTAGDEGEIIKVTERAGLQSGVEVKKGGKSQEAGLNAGRRGRGCNVEGWPAPWEGKKPGGF